MTHPGRWYIGEKKKGNIDQHEHQTYHEGPGLPAIRHNLAAVQDKKALRKKRNSGYGYIENKKSNSLKRPGGTSVKENTGTPLKYLGGGDKFPKT